MKKTKRQFKQKIRLIFYNNKMVVGFFKLKKMETKLSSQIELKSHETIKLEGKNEEKDPPPPFKNVQIFLQSVYFVFLLCTLLLLGFVCSFYRLRPSLLALKML